MALRRPSESAMALAAASPSREASARPLRLAESPGLSDLLRSLYKIDIVTINLECQVQAAIAIPM